MVMIGICAKCGATMNADGRHQCGKMRDDALAERDAACEGVVTVANERDAALAKVAELERDLVAAKAARWPTCEHCEERQAVCLGRYEDDQGPERFACAECCAHGNEDGHCEMLTDANVIELRDALAESPVSDRERADDAEKRAERTERFLVAALDDLEETVKLLRWLHMLGGLGHEKHDRIEATLRAVEDTLTSRTRERPSARDIGALLRRVRTKAGKTMGDLARFLGSSVVVVSDLERGRIGEWVGAYPIPERITLPSMDDLAPTDDGAGT